MRKILDAGVMGLRAVKASVRTFADKIIDHIIDRFIDRLDDRYGKQMIGIITDIVNLFNFGI